HLATLVDVVGRGVTEGVGGPGDAAGRVVVEGGVQVAAGVLAPDAAAGRVVGVAVPAAVAVGPAGHPAVGVVVEPHRPAGGVDGLGQVPAGVVAVAAQGHGGSAAFRVMQVEGGDAVVGGVDGDPVAAGVAYRGERAGGVVVEVDAVAVAVGDRRQRPPDAS